MSTNKCPVCGKPDIPDYHKEDVTCPQCKSDLSIYRIIDKIPEEKSGFNIWKAISAVAILATAVCGFFLFQNRHSGVVNTKDNSTLVINQLRDSISVLEAKLKEPENTTAAYNYIVRKGDSYCLISSRIYGDESHAEEIASNNHRTLQTPLYVGDTIKLINNGTNKLD